MRQMPQDEVVLVDEHGLDLCKDDGVLVTMEKMEAHRRGLLHRAVSVFIFNDRNEFLLHKRSFTKYHTPGKWTNTCCTHPSPGENPIVAARRRLIEEMGFVSPLTEIFTFAYKANVGNGLIENEFDHVFVGVFNHDPNPNPEEVSDWRWVAINELEQDLNKNPDSYTPWLQQCFSQVVIHRGSKYKG